MTRQDAAFSLQKLRKNLYSDTWWVNAIAVQLNCVQVFIVTCEFNLNDYSHNE